MTGKVTWDAVFALVRGVMHRMPVSRTPVVTWVTELDVCEVCGAAVCDCITPAAMAALLQRIDADPHGTNDLSGLGLPY